MKIPNLFLIQFLTLLKWKLCEDIFAVANLKRNIPIFGRSMNIWFNDIFIKSHDNRRKFFPDGLEHSDEIFTFSSALGVYPHQISFSNKIDIPNEVPEEYTAGFLLIYSYDLANCASKIYEHNFDLNQMYHNCPNRCNARPCMFIKNAFEDSCETVFLNSENKKTFFDYTDSRKMLMQHIRADVRQRFDDMLQISFKCECYNNYEWVNDDSNDSGGVCIFKKPTCEKIRCETGQCIIAHDEEAKCICPPSFTGTFCELPFDPCQKGDHLCPKNECYRDPANHKYGYYCNCGKEINLCANYPCQNNGTCISTNMGFKCLCFENFYGEKCEFHKKTIVTSNWSAWDKWSNCHLESNDCIQISKRYCVDLIDINNKNTNCYGASKRRRLCTYFSEFNFNCSMDHSRSRIFSDYFIIYDYIYNLKHSK